MGFFSISNIHYLSNLQGMGDVNRSDVKLE